MTQNSSLPQAQKWHRLFRANRGLTLPTGLSSTMSTSSLGLEAPLLPVARPSLTARTTTLTSLPRSAPSHPELHRRGDPLRAATRRAACRRRSLATLTTTSVMASSPARQPQLLFRVDCMALFPSRKSLAATTLCIKTFCGPKMAIYGKRAAGDCRWSI